MSCALTRSGTFIDTPVYGDHITGFIPDQPRILPTAWYLRPSPVKDGPKTAEPTHLNKSNFETITAYELISSTGWIFTS